MEGTGEGISIKARKEASAMKAQQIAPEDPADPAEENMLDCWISLEAARECSFGKVEWWKCEGINGECVEVKQHHPRGPADRPIWCHEDGWMYLGSWKDDDCHGFGVYYFLNGRVYVGNLDRNKCSGLAKLFWLPDSPIWERNELPLSIIKARAFSRGPRRESEGLPYIYIGNFVDSEKNDPRAKVILKDGTTRIGPFKDDKPVGDWWTDHEKAVTSQEELEIFFSFVSQGESMLVDGSWLTLDEARDRSRGKVEWWKCQGPSGERLEQRQYHPSGPLNRPVWLDENGCMYLGGWRYDHYHGFGVLCFPNGRLYVGNLSENECSGLGMLAWLPAAPVWEKNDHPQSFVTTNLGKAKIGLPYIYIGKFQYGERNDPSARVILKDGTTRIGPFKGDEPVGNWWMDHEKDTTSNIKLSALLSFRYPTQVSTDLEIWTPTATAKATTPALLLLAESNGRAQAIEQKSSNSSALMEEEHSESEESFNMLCIEKEYFGRLSRLQSAAPSARGKAMERRSSSKSVLLEQDPSQCEESFSMICIEKEFYGRLSKLQTTPSARDMNYSFGLDRASIANINDELDREEGSWVSLEDARKYSYEDIEWWTCEGPYGERVEGKQHRVDGPVDRPVWLDRKGCMYLGSWSGFDFHGFGILYYPDGHLYAGHFYSGECSGPAKVMWLPSAPIWVKNVLPRSPVKFSGADVWEERESDGLPFIYLGTFRNGRRDDHHARVILKDGTTRFGPFKDDFPVGNWWNDHEESVTNQKEFDKLLFFAMDKPAIAFRRSSSTSTTESRPGSWLTLEEARERSYGKVEWWKCEGPYGERVEGRQQRPDGPSDRPVWLDKNNWMYLGGWNGKEYNGYGVLHFPNGRLFAGHLERGKCSGPAKLLWLPESPDWKKNEQLHSAIACSVIKDGKSVTVGVPYIYIGNFSNSKRSDPAARVILKDGTTRIGPFKDDKPVGDWWSEHQKASTSLAELNRFLSFSKVEVALSSLAARLPKFQIGKPKSFRRNVKGRRENPWLTLEQAQERSYGKVKWWKCEGPYRERVSERQHRASGPSDRPVWLDSNGWMYLGGWKGNAYHGFGILYFPNGRVFAGYLENNKCSGPAKLVWLPTSPTWATNEQPRSAIKTLSPEDGVEGAPIGRPYIYIGCFKNNERTDSRAKVILKDGTTRVGPFRADKPVGDWWNDHEECFTTPGELEKLSNFGTD